MAKGTEFAILRRMKKKVWIVMAVSLLFLLPCNSNILSIAKKQPAGVLAVKSPAVQEPETKSLRQSLINLANKYLGVRYKYASASPAKGFDCSGFVNYVFKQFSISLPRSSAGFKNIGKAKKPSEFKVGDVVVFYGYRDSKSIGHVGIICEANGMESKFIHASSGKEMAVTVSELGSKMYTRRFYKCIDPFLL